MSRGRQRIRLGLQVYGVLPEADWWAWDERFQEATAGLPCRVLG